MHIVLAVLTADCVMLASSVSQKPPCDNPDSCCCCGVTSTAATKWVPGISQSSWCCSPACDGQGSSLTTAPLSLLQFNFNRGENKLRDTVSAAKIQGGPLSELVPSEQGMLLLEGLLTLDPAQRLTAEQALHHPW